MFERRGSVFLLLGMLAWVIAGLVGALLVATVLGFGAVLLRQVLGFDFVPEPGLLAYVLAGSTGFQGILIFGARCGKGVGLAMATGAPASAFDGSATSVRSPCSAL